MEIQGASAKGGDGLRVAADGWSGRRGGYARRRAMAMVRPAPATCQAEKGSWFVHSNVYDLPQVLDGEFDVVFISWGALGWLPDLARWAQVIARYLKPGGAFYIADRHPGSTLMFRHGSSTNIPPKTPTMRRLWRSTKARMPSWPPRPRASRS